MAVIWFPEMSIVFLAFQLYLLVTNDVLVPGLVFFFPFRISISCFMSFCCFIIFSLNSHFTDNFLLGYFISRVDK